VENGQEISVGEAASLVRYVEELKIAADPHPRRLPLGKDQVEAIAKGIVGPLNELMASERGRLGALFLGPRIRTFDGDEVTLSLGKPVHKLIHGAAVVTQRTKRELAQDLMESAGAMGRVAGLKRLERSSGGARVSAHDIVDTWVGMLVAAACISGEIAPGTARLGRVFRGALVDWYAQYSHRGAERLEEDL